MLDADRPITMSKPTAPDASFAVASSAELYVAISTFFPVSFWNALTRLGSR